ncbi:hypothetical protein [Haladaptatus sp. W1]|uniref:hypothetical protein n=1 Tax=Haladaptatus sp. W1 TaxID=1897478 RepID=UPI000ADF8A54|nr:hypothetical protein [Haladaptatus sp. W1]
MPDTDKRETLKLLSLGAVALSGVGAGVVAGNDDTDSDSNSGSDAEQQPPTELFSTGVLTGENEVPRTRATDGGSPSSSGRPTATSNTDSSRSDSTRR